MRTACLLISTTTVSAFAPASGSVGGRHALRPSMTDAKSSFIQMQQNNEEPLTYEEYLRARGQTPGGVAQQAPPPQAVMPPPQQQAPPPQQGGLFSSFFNGNPQQSATFIGADEVSDSDDDYERVPWWKQDGSYSEKQRKDRRTIFMHDDWVRHRSSERFLRNMRTIGSSGINQALSTELAFVTMVSVFVVVFNMLFYNYQDFNGVVHPGALNFLDANIKSLSLPALPFSTAMPALSLLLVFRTNTAYFRWNEARTLWGGLINNCRNVIRQSNTFFPSDDDSNGLKFRMAAETGAFIRSLRNFLRGPSDDSNLRAELSESVAKGYLPASELDAIMGASNRPMFCLSAMSATLRKANLDPIQQSRIDSTISILVDLTGANERIFKSPIPLVYTRLTARFLTVFLTLFPLALWGQMGESWNHWATIPFTFGISFFLFGIEEVGIQIEEPFSILPLEAFCNGAICATNEEMLAAVGEKVFDEPTSPMPATGTRDS